jgi:hypothetical protein
MTFLIHQLSFNKGKLPVILDMEWKVTTNAWDLPFRHILNVTGHILGANKILQYAASYCSL